MAKPAMAATSGITTRRMRRRVLLSRPESGFFLVSAAGGACSPGNFKTGSAIAPFPHLAALASCLIGGANVFFYLLELHEQAVRLCRLQMGQCGFVDLFAQRTQLHHDGARSGRQ